MDALALCELLAKRDPARYDRAALRWLERFIDEWPARGTNISAPSAQNHREGERALLAVAKREILSGYRGSACAGSSYYCWSSERRAISQLVQ